MTDPVKMTNIESASPVVRSVVGHEVFPPEVHVFHSMTNLVKMTNLESTSPVAKMTNVQKMTNLKIATYQWSAE